MVTGAEPRALLLLLTEVLDLARAVGEQIARIRTEGLETSRKADRSLVTRADHEADAALREGLSRLLPAAWLSEETADTADRVTHERVWIVDPLDGTKEFVEGLPEYGVAIALAEHGEPVLAVVHNPATADMFWAVKGQGAFHNGTPIRVREGDSLLASRSECASGEFAPFAASWQVSPIGSIAYKLALVAAGSAAATFSRGPKHEWDVCAGALIVSEAGGRVSDAFGDPLRFNQPFPKVKGILAGAPGAYSRALEQMASAGPSDRMGEVMNLSKPTGGLGADRE